MRQLNFLIIVCIVLINFVSCDPCSDYNYIISNESEKELLIEIYPDHKVDDDPEYRGYYWSRISFLQNSELKIDNSQTLITLKSRQALSFLDCIGMSAYVQKNPENDGSFPLWLEHSCLRKIVVGETEEGKERVIPVEYWSNRDNWIRQNKKKRYVEYWLKIDDSVISQESVLLPIN